MAYQKKPKKLDLYLMLDAAIKENEKIKAETVQKWLEKRPQATEKFYTEINKIFPGMVCKVTFEHVDASGYWFTFELKNDAHRQTYAIRHSEIMNGAPIW